MRMWLAAVIMLCVLWATLAAMSQPKRRKCPLEALCQRMAKHVAMFEEMRESFTRAGIYDGYKVEFEIMRGALLKEAMICVGDEVEF